MLCSLLIISNKKAILTLEGPGIWKYPSEILTSETPGVSTSRNEIAGRAKGEILAFMDDDIFPDFQVWGAILNVRPNEVLMFEGYRHPITRIMALHKEAFLDIGGFDENIKYNGEDLDFYWRALDKGYTISIIPKCLVFHKPHKKSNWVRYHFESAYTRVKHGRMSLDFFVQTNPVIALLRLTGFIYHYLRSK